ncbi:MAG TPA: LamB/YcsF family protein [Algoriphagus sp.]|nr:LamB/YcsF family protein [Algoriphagus sp.]
MPNNSYTINCDLGEGMPNEAQVIPLIDLASVACGGHFGDRSTINATLELVRKSGKKAGAHPSYPDLVNFGRKSVVLKPDELIQSLWDQIGLFREVADGQNIPVDHIKFHGALYNDAAENKLLAEILVDFMKRNFPEIPLFVPPHTELEKAAQGLKLPIRLEIFGDRAYQDNYKLVSRSLENSLFTQTEQVNSHLESIINLGKIRTYSGQMKPVHADTVCFHGDNPGILEFLPIVRDRFWK